MQNDEYLNAGHISGVFGVKGLVKVYSHTQPRENILQYSPWLLRKKASEQEIKLVRGQRHGNAIIAELDGISDRDVASSWIGAEIFIQRKQLPKTQPGEYYWNDLIGLQVENLEGEVLGVVDYLLETGANDVLVVIHGENERLIPFLQGQTVTKIDLDERRMIVDWDADF